MSSRETQQSIVHERATSAVPSRAVFRSVRLSHWHPRPTATVHKDAAWRRVERWVESLHEAVSRIRTGGPTRSTDRRLPEIIDTLATSVEVMSAADDSEAEYPPQFVRESVLMMRLVNLICGRSVPGIQRGPKGLRDVAARLRMMVDQNRVVRRAAAEWLWPLVEELRLVVADGPASLVPGGRLPRSAYANSGR